MLLAVRFDQLDREVPQLHHGGRLLFVVALFVASLQVDSLCSRALAFQSVSMLEANVMMWIYKNNKNVLTTVVTVSIH
jgi:hypothetical protein